MNITDEELDKWEELAHIWEAMRGCHYEPSTIIGRLIAEVRRLRETRDD